MAIPSNLYAEKVFAEHPLDLWALDDSAHYISLISESDRDISSWTAVDGSASLIPDIQDEPFISSHVSKIVGDAPLGDSGTASFSSSNIKNFMDLNEELGTMCISSYFFVVSPYISAIKLGYEYYDTTTGNNVRVYKNISVGIFEKWFFVSETFDYPSENVSFRIFIEMEYLNGGPSHEHSAYVNGLAAGQWAEEFSSTNLGLSAEALPSNLPLSGMTGSPIIAYGLSDNNGYYLIKDERLLAKNTGIPMVYGGSSLTKIYPNSSGDPSLIIPGEGMFNKIAQYNEMTLEFWLRMSVDSSYQQKLVGPIASDDGLYVRGPTLLLKVGNQYSAYFVHEWNRPMLINIRLSKNNASLLINGEEVISFDLDTSSVSYPDPVDESGNSLDWIGFYSYENFSSVEIDCIAIYGYKVPAVVAKRRFVYGQGVEFPENINTSYSGTSMFIDYRFADYTNNYNYPEIGKWQQGNVDNFQVKNNTLSLPTYQLPSVISNHYTSDTLIDEVGNIQNEDKTFLKLNPVGDSSYQTCLYFDNFNFISGGTRAIYAIVKDLAVYDNMPIFTIYDSVKKNYLQVLSTDSSIDYIIKYNSDPVVFNSIKKFYPGEEYAVGFDAKRLSNYFGGNVAAFLGQKGSLSLYVGNDKDLSKDTYDGNIYSINFMNARNSELARDSFAPNGIVWDADAGTVWDNELFNPPPDIDMDAGSYSNLFYAFVLDGGGPAAYALSSLANIVPTYGLILTKLFGQYQMDIVCKSHWEDYIPLSYFAQYVEDKAGVPRYDLDFLQFNIGYPAPATFFETESDPESWSYAELYNEYSNPIQRSYESLDNQLFTGYNDYEDLQNRSAKTYSYNTASSLIKTYISFQYISSGANAPETAFTNIEPAPKNGIIRPGTNWMNTKYEVVNNMIIYPPSGINFEELAIVTHLDSEVAGVNSFPIQIRSLEYCSQALSENAYNPIGTRFGVPVYPYKRSGIYYSFKEDNPFSIYKGSSPYLYLTRYSGIQPRGAYDPLISRGLMTPMNQNQAADYKVIAMQASLRFDEDFFPYAPTQIMEVEAKDRFIKIYMQATHPNGSRAKIYAINGYTGQLEDGIAFYWNGNIVKNPVISLKEWGTLGISFASPLDVANTIGFIRITGPVLVNNISHYQSTNLQEVQQISSRPWFKVKAAGATTFEWEFWKDYYLWQGVLVVATTAFYGVDPSDIYKTYVGTNKIIVDDERRILFGNYAYTSFSDVEWQTETVSPV